MRRRALLTATALLPILGCVRDGGRPIAGAGITRPDGAFLASLDALLDSAGVPGIAMGVVSRGRVVWESHAGVIEENGAAVGAATIWKAASLSKQVSAYTALRLVGAGALALDRPLASYLGDEAPADAEAQRITARHVLTHSSGLPNWRRTGDLIPQFAPGTGFLYSGEGFFLLARCIERITGLGFEAHVQQAVFEPLGMDSSSYLWRADLATRLATGHRWDGEPWDDAAWRDGLHARMLASTLPVDRWTLDRIASAMAPTSGPEQGVPLLPGAIRYPNPAMSLMTTVPDYLALVSRFMTPVGDGLDLPPALRALAAQPMVRINRTISWGLGWGIERAGGTQYLFQHGALAGACTSFVLLHPPSQTGIVVFTNHSNGQRVAERVFRAASGHEHPVFLWA